MSTRGTLSRHRAGRREYRLADGMPAVGWLPASRPRRLAAWLLDVGLFVTTLGVGWLVWLWRGWARGTTPGKALLGVTVFGTDTHRPATRSRMAQRALVYQLAAALIGLATLGVGWLYCVGSVLGANRRTVYDDWSRTVLLQRPRPASAAARSQRGGWRRRTGIEPA
jgi:hypothetical protein